MMISAIYSTSLYVMSLMLFLNFNSSIFFWILMELNLISFILIMFLSKSFMDKQDSLNYTVFYFLIQSSASILFLSNYSLVEWSSIFNYDVMFLVSMIFKIGLFPIFFWIFSLAEKLDIFSLVLLLTLQKIPLLCSLYYSNSAVLMYILFLSFSFGCVMVLYSDTILNLFIWSSISYSMMLYFLFMLNGFSFIVFFLLYSGAILLCSSHIRNYLKVSNLYPLFCYFFFLGLPPLSLFFYKFMFLDFLSLFMGVLEVFFFWGFTFISILGYVKHFYSSFFNINSLYYSSVPLYLFYNSIFVAFVLFLGFCF